MDPIEIFRAIAPEFDYLEDDDLERYLEIAGLEVPIGFCGDKRPLLVAYLIAHMVTIARRSMGASGEVSSITEGSLSISYGKGNNISKSIGLSNTSYGQEYDRLFRSCSFSFTTGKVAWQ